MPIITKEQLKSTAVRRIEVMELPELGAGFEIKVQSFMFGDILRIEQSSTSVDPDGNPTYNKQNDALLSLMEAIAEPALTIEDTEWLLKLPYGIGTRIIQKAKELSFATESSFEQAKRMLKANPYLRQLYSICVNKLGRLPSELAEISENEFNMALAALELNAEDEAEALKDAD